MRSRVVFAIGAVAVLAALTMVPTAMAQGAGMPRGVLPEEEAATGWINLFDKETTYGWNAMGDAQWKVVDGVLTCDSGSGGLLATTSQFADFELEVKMRVSGETSSSGLQVRAALQGHPSENGSAVVSLRESQEGEHAWHTVHVTASGSDLSATVDGKAVEELGRSRSVAISASSTTVTAG